MAYRINCGKPERNEVTALNRLAVELPRDWALFTNIPRHLTGSGSKGREIDALALSPHGAVVIELKHLGGLISITPPGEWYVAGQILTDQRGNPQYPLQQAGKAAQILKSMLGAAARGTYIEACAIATVDSARIRFTDPARPQPTMTINDAAEGIEALARTTRGVSYPALQAFFDLVGHRLPSSLDALWRKQTDERTRESSYAQGRKRGEQTNWKIPGQGRSQGPRQATSSFGWVVLALFAGILLGLYLVAPAWFNLSLFRRA